MYVHEIGTESSRAVVLATGQPLSGAVGMPEPPALDVAAIQEQLAGLMEGKTVIAIAHRLSTIARMDRLVVLDCEVACFGDAAFDAVVAFSILEHLKQDALAQALGEVHRVLAPGGREPFRSKKC